MFPSVSGHDIYLWPEVEYYLSDMVTFDFQVDKWVGITFVFLIQDIDVFCLFFRVCAFYFMQ